MKAFICILLVSSCFDSTAQSSNILALKKKKNFSEENLFWKDSLITLYQEVSFNDPYTIDEEYGYYLFIEFHDSIDLSKKNRFDLYKDSALVTVKFKRNSVWDWSSSQKITNGHISILSHEKKDIRVELAFIFRRVNRDREYTYSGTRRFTLGKKPDYFERVVRH